MQNPQTLIVALLLSIIFSYFYTHPALAEETAIPSNLSVSLEGSYGSFQPATASYLGTQIGAGPNIFNFVKIDDRQDFKSTNLNIHYNLPNQNFCKSFTDLKLFGGVEKSRADDGRRFNRLDPNGDNLLIPGVGVGPNGVGFLLPGANNQIVNGIYDTEFDYYKVMLGLSAIYKTQNHNLKIIPSIGIDYQHSETKNNFGGNIPFFVRQFSYNTTTKVKTISPTIGVDLSYRINSMISFFSGAQYAYNLNKGRGLDNLSFTGFGTQTAVMRNNKNTNSFGLKAGFDINLKLPVTFSIEGRYQRLGNVPVMNVRDSISISSFSYDDADILSGSLRATYKF